jgi:RNA polymerase sigma-70 factor (ECF subfamily)
MNCVTKAWTSHEAELSQYLRNHINSIDTAEELLQDTFLKAIRLGAKFCAIENPRAWLFTVARHQLIDHFRKFNQQQSEDLESNTIEQLPEIKSTQATVEQLSDCLPLALKNIAAEDSEILKQCDFKGMNQAEYAKLHGLSLAATKSRIQRARKRLKAQLKTQCQIRFDEQGNVCCFTPNKVRVSAK